jgi:NitT/TauT family transport system permease protein
MKNRIDREQPGPLRLERARRRQRSLTRRGLRYIPPLLVLALGVGLWQALTVLRNVPDWLLPGPSSIWKTTLDEHDLLLQNTVPTLEEAVIGFLLALAFGLALAIAIRYSRLVELALYPILIGTQSVPLLALAPILTVLFGYSVLPKLILVCLVCFFPIVVNAVDGFKSVDPDLVNLMRTLGAGKLRLFRDVELPTALPYIFSGAKVAATFAVIGAVVGELAGGSEGLAYLMIQKQSQFDTAAIFSAMIILTALGIGMFLAVAIVERLAMPWHHGERRRNEL